MCCEEHIFPMATSKIRYTYTYLTWYPNALAICSWNQSADEWFWSKWCVLAMYQKWQILEMANANNSLWKVTLPSLVLCMAGRMAFFLVLAAMSITATSRAQVAVNWSNFKKTCQRTLTKPFDRFWGSRPHPDRSKCELFFISNYLEIFPALPLRKVTGKFGQRS